MRVRFAVLACALVSVGALLGADTYPRNPDVDIRHYAFSLTLSDTTDEIAGTATVDVRFARPGVTDYTLDLVGRAAAHSTTGMIVEAVREGVTIVPFHHVNDRLRIWLVTPASADESRRFSIAYRGTPADGLMISTNMHGERTFFADNFPDRARHWLPTLDHPSDKATCEFVVTAPDRYRVIATGLRIEESDLAEGGRRTHWRTSVPISTYNMVLGAARFAVRSFDRAGAVPIETWAYPQDRDAWFRAFAVAPRIIEFYAFRVGPYAYEKLASVQSRTKFGGMENAGNIFYTERLNVEKGAEDIAAHEIAHQWFGNSVTEADWHHAWLSEGFATYLTHLYHEFTYGRERLMSGMQKDRRTVIDYARKRPDLRVVDPRLHDNRVLSPYTYQKGAWVLHMLRRRVGDERFWAGLREFYRRYRDSTALSEDFRDVMQEVSGLELSEFFRQWLYEAGHPVLHLVWTYDGPAKVFSATVDQTQTGPPFSFDLDLELTFRDGTHRIETVEIAGRSRSFTVPLESAPVAVTMDPNSWLLAEFDPARQESTPRRRARAAGCRSQVAGCRLRVAGSKLQVASYRLQVTGCRHGSARPVASNQQPVT